MLAQPPESRHSRLRRERRANGLCGYTGCDVQTGDDAYYCPAHKLVHSRRMKALRLAKRQAKAAS